MRLATLLLLSFLLLAQTPTPTIRVTTRLVHVNVIVRSKGAPVTDLTAADFELRDRGKPQKVAFFSLNSATTAPEPSKAAAPNIFTNRRDPAADKPTATTVLLIDGLNTDLAHQSFARDKIRKVLAELDPSQRIAIYALGRDLHVIHDFTDDREQLARVVARFRGENITEALPLNNDLGVIQMLDTLHTAENAEKNEKVYFEGIRVMRTIDAFDAIAKHLANIPGNKSLVWISGSFPIYPGFQVITGTYETSRQQSFTANVARTARLFSNANITIYPVDVRGLFSTNRYGAEGGATSRPTLDRSSHNPFQADNREPMRLLADGTGGIAYFDNNDLAKALRQAIADSQASYTLGFYPSQETLDGKYHELIVKVARKGVEVRHRKGYLATPESEPGAEDRQAMLRNAFWSPLETVAIEIRTRAEKHSGTVDLLIETNPETLALNEQEQRHTGAMDIYVSQCDARGNELQTTRDSLELNLTPQRWALRKEHWLPLKKTVELKPGAVQLRVVVQDKANGALGSVIIPVTKLPG